MNNYFNLTLVNSVADAAVVTHLAPHHGDETMTTAIFILKEGRVDVLRTRDREMLAAAMADENVCVYDVGGSYNPEFGNFDHHQREMSHLRPQTFVNANGEEEHYRYSSAGLLWERLGVDVCITVTGCTLAQAEQAAAKVDEMLIFGIDAIDNGQPVGDNAAMNFSQAISLLNPNWDEQLDADEAFIEACQLAHLVLTRTIKSCVAQVKGRDAVEEAIEASENGVMVLPCYINGWQETVLQSSNPKAKDILYGVFRNLQGKHTVMAMPPSLEEGMKQRKSLPQTWAGTSREELIKLTGVADVIFCHPQRFTCGAVSLQGAIKLARLAAAAE